MINNFRNALNKKIKNAKTEYFQKNFETQNNQWKFLKNFNNKSKQHPPNNITHQGKQITSPKEIATIANDFLLTKSMQ